jgi:hypothetical protein
MTIEPVKLIAQALDRYTPWACLREAGVRADRLGVDPIWTWIERDVLAAFAGSSASSCRG